MLHKLNIAPHTDSIHWLLVAVCLCVFVVRCGCAASVEYNTLTECRKKAHHSADAAIVDIHIDTYPLTQPFGLLAVGLSYDRRANINNSATRNGFTLTGTRRVVFGCDILWSHQTHNDSVYFFSRLYYIVSCFDSLRHQHNCNAFAVGQLLHSFCILTMICISVR